MNLQNPRRNELMNIPFMNNALDWILSRINAMWLVEHDGEGHHTAITGTSLTITEDVTIEGDVYIDGLVDQVDLGTASVPMVLDGAQVGPGTFREITDGFSQAVTADNTRPAITGSRDLIPVTDDTSYLGWVGDGTFVRRWRSIYFSQAVYGPSVIATTGFWESAYGAGVGKWTAVSYAAGNFTAESGTWTVDSGDVTHLRYTLIGKTMTVAFHISGTDVSATPTYLQITIPASKTAAYLTMNCIATQDAGGTVQFGMAVVNAGTTGIKLYRDATSGGALWSTTAADNTAVTGQITFEVQ